MPIYSYQCPDCDAIKDEYRSVENRNDCPECDLCRTSMVKTISAYSVVGDLEPYYDDNLQAGVRSKQHRKQLMREQGLYEKFGSNWSTAASSKRARH